MIATIASPPTKAPLVMPNGQVSPQWQFYFAQVTATLNALVAAANAQS